MGSWSRKGLLGCFCLGWFGCLILGTVAPVRAQSTEVQQLLLNVEKLSQLKNILEDMKKGYTVVTNGYNAIRNISQGNFSLHELFLDGMMLVNPEIKKYRRVADIISYQGKILSEYKAAFKRLNSSGTFSPEELAYFGRVYQQLFVLSMDNLDELLTVIMVSELRMSDQERLGAIDRIFVSVEDKLVFLRDFNRDAFMVLGMREKEKIELGVVSGFYP